MRIRGYRCAPAIDISCLRAGVATRRRCIGLVRTLPVRRPSPLALGGRGGLVRRGQTHLLVVLPERPCSAWHAVGSERGASAAGDSSKAIHTVRRSDRPD